MSASPDILPPIVYGRDRHGAARSDLPATAASLTALAEAGQAWCDRIGAPVSCQCRPSSVPAAETYSSNPASVSPPVPWYRCPTVCGWVITQDGSASILADVAGMVTQTGDEQQPSTCAWAHDVSLITGRGPISEIGAAVTISSRGGTISPVTSSAIPASRLPYTAASAVSSRAYSPSQYAGILIGSGGYPTSTADLASLSVVQQRARFASSLGQWARGVPDKGPYSERNARIAVSVGASQGLGPTLLTVGQLATSITRVPA